MSDLPVDISHDQHAVRLAKLAELRAAGSDPFRAEFATTHFAGDARRAYVEGQENTVRVNVAGRLVVIRDMGKSQFVKLFDQQGGEEGGPLQLYVKKDVIGDEAYAAFKKLDLGDILGAEGTLFKTKTGEVTVRVERYVLLSKALRPLPEKWHGLSDPEQVYRQRYLDLIVNPESRNRLLLRSRVVSGVRRFLEARQFIEVETPVLQSVAGGAAARPFTTHHNTLDMKLYLRIANELYLKRLIVGGFDGVYEFSKDFRNEGMSRFHNPEFTQIELYVAYKDYEWMMNLVEEMVEKVAIDLHGTTKVQVGENIIDFKRPWKRYTMYEAIQHFTGIDISEMNEDQLRETARSLHVPIDKTMGKGKLIDEIFGEKCEGNLIQPTFITDYPVEMSPLAKKHASKPGLVERFEAICNKKEICNAFSELNDPIDQRQRFEAQLELGKRGDEEAMMLDEDFLRALEYGMPPTAGLGIGMDRLAMIMTNQNSIQDVLFFPQMKAEKE